MSTDTVPNQPPTNRLVLSRAEAWVVHHVVLAHLLDEDADADEQPWWALEAAEKLEGDDARFTAFEAWRLRCALLDYAGEDGTPDADVALSVAIVDRIEREFDGPPAALC
ncbi:hypothetical protein [Halorubellus litoreus]|uniref:Uncharacterized protein n=1 Tax=Halorubellus litoreus TaxID=755308 RepID=A0ABD5VKY6_9EURY